MKTAPEAYRVFVDHGEAYGNLGDEAMLISALSRLERHLGPCTFVLPREGERPLPALGDFSIQLVLSPFEAFRRASERLEQITARLSRFGVPHPPGLRWRLKMASLVAGTEVTAAVRGCDVFYGVGAADFNDFNALGAAYKCWLYLTARPAVRVMAVSAQGIGPLRNPDLRHLMRAAFKDLDLLSFRDSHYSAHFVKDLGPLGCRTRIVGDEAFSLAPAPVEARDQYLSAAGLGADEPFIAVHWRSTDYVQETAGFYPRVARVFEAASRLCNASLVFFPMSYDVHSRHDDECCAEIRAHMGEPSKLLMAPVTHDVSLIKAAIGASRFTLGLSYHVHVFGLSQGLPALVLYSGEYYRFKSEGLTGFYGPPTTSVDLSQPDGEAIALRALERMHEAGDSARKDIAQRNGAILAENDWTLAEIRRLLQVRECEPVK